MLLSTTNYFNTIQLLSNECEVEEIGDGNLNDVWRIRSRKDSDNSVIVKHSPPYIKVIYDIIYLYS